MQTADDRRKRESKKSLKDERRAENEHQTSRPTLEQQGVKFYYDREHRLRKLKTGKPERRRIRFFSKGRTRTLIIILIDIILIAILIYTLNKPTNLYLEKSVDDVYYELNVTGIRGGKMLIGLTIRNLSDANMEINDSLPVLLRITDSNDSELTFERYVEKNTVLLTDEATSVIFLIENDQLPRAGRLDVVFESDVVFSRNVRF